MQEHDSGSGYWLGSSERPPLRTCLPRAQCRWACSHDPPESAKATPRSSVATDGPPSGKDVVSRPVWGRVAGVGVAIGTGGRLLGALCRRAGAKAKIKNFVTLGGDTRGGALRSPHMHLYDITNKGYPFVGVTRPQLRACSAGSPRKKPQVEPWRAGPGSSSRANRDARQTRQTAAGVIGFATPYRLPRPPIDGIGGVARRNRSRGRRGVAAARSGGGWAAASGRAGVWRCRAHRGSHLTRTPSRRRAVASRGISLESSLWTMPNVIHVLRDDQARADRHPPVADPRRAPPGRVRVDRGLVQHAPPPLRARLPHPRRCHHQPARTRKYLLTSPPVSSTVWSLKTASASSTA
jgi:hypothetical protein